MNTNAVKIEFICGTSFNQAGWRLSEAEVAAAKVTATRILLEEFGGYSQSTVEGAWRSPKTGAVANDVSLVYSCIVSSGPANNHLEIIQAKLVEAFQQESVPYIITPVFCKF